MHFLSSLIMHNHTIPNKLASMIAYSEVHQKIFINTYKYIHISGQTTLLNFSALLSTLLINVKRYFHSENWCHTNFVQKHISIVLKVSSRKKWQKKKIKNVICCNFESQFKFKIKLLSGNSLSISSSDFALFPSSEIPKGSSSSFDMRGDVVLPRPSWAYTVWDSSIHTADSCNGPENKKKP